MLEMILLLLPIILPIFGYDIKSQDHLVMTVFELGIFRLAVALFTRFYNANI